MSHLNGFFPSKTALTFLFKVYCIKKSLVIFSSWIDEMWAVKYCFVVNLALHILHLNFFPSCFEEMCVFKRILSPKKNHTCHIWMVSFLHEQFQHVVSKFVWISVLHLSNSDFFLLCFEEMWAVKYCFDVNFELHMSHSNFFPSWIEEIWAVKLPLDVNLAVHIDARIFT